MKRTFYFFAALLCLVSCRVEDVSPAPVCDDPSSEIVARVCYDDTRLSFSENSAQRLVRSFEVGDEFIGCCPKDGGYESFSYRVSSICGDSLTLVKTSGAVGVPAADGGAVAYFFYAPGIAASDITSDGRFALDISSQSDTLIPAVMYACGTFHGAREIELDFVNAAALVAVDASCLTLYDCDGSLVPDAVSFGWVTLDGAVTSAQFSVGPDGVTFTPASASSSVTVGLSRAFAAEDGPVYAAVFPNDSPSQLSLTLGRVYANTRYKGSYATLAAMQMPSIGGNGYFAVGSKASPKRLDMVPVALVGTVKYGTLESAFEAVAGRSAVIKMLSDAEVTAPVAISGGKAVTLSLEGCDIALDSSAGFALSGKGTALTVNGSDSSLVAGSGYIFSLTDSAALSVSGGCYCSRKAQSEISRRSTAEAISVSSGLFHNPVCGYYISGGAAQYSPCEMAGDTYNYKVCSGAVLRIGPEVNCALKNVARRKNSLADTVTTTKTYDETTLKIRINVSTPASAMSVLKEGDYEDLSAGADCSVIAVATTSSIIDIYTEASVIGSGSEPSYMFRRFTNLTAIEGLTGLNTSSATTFYYTFAGLNSLQSLDLSSFDTQLADDYRYMFSGCLNLRSLRFGEKFIIARNVEVTGMMGGSTATYVAYNCTKSNPCVMVCPPEALQKMCSNLSALRTKCLSTGKMRIENLKGHTYTYNSDYTVATDPDPEQEKPCRAVIGVSFCNISGSTQYCIRKSLEDAGAKVVFFDAYTDTDEMAAEYMLQVDGLLIPGLATGDSDDGRSKYDTRLVNVCRSTGQPMLGICAGHQRISSVYGGTTSLVSSVAPGAESVHKYTVDGVNVGVNTEHHWITITEGSRLWELLGRETRVKVNTSHNYVVSKLPSAFTQTAVSDEGLNEAYEAPHIMGVQFHPEYLYGRLGLTRFLPIFENLVDEAEEYAQTR